MTAHELNPGELLQLSGKYWETCTLHAGVKLDVFSILGDQALTAGEIARTLGGNQRSVEMLLNALSAMNLLRKNGAEYSNTPASRAFLVKSAQRYVGHIIKHHHHLVDSWFRLDESILSGAPVRDRAAFDEDERRESFLMGMFNIAMSLAPTLVPLVDLTGRHRLLDVGGGPGTWAIQFCLANPTLEATVCDLPTTRAFAEKTIERFGLTDRIDFMGVDYLEEDLQGQFDVAWLSQILHSESPEDCRKIIDQAVSVLEPGGLILIHEFILDNTLDGPLFPALFSLNMLLGTPGGQSYSEKQLVDMLSDAGVRDLKRVSFDSPNDSGIVAGIVP